MRQCNNHYIPLTNEMVEDIMAAVEREEFWGGLGDGQTLEDIIYQKLADYGADRCPECGRRVAISEELLGRMSMQMLTHS